MPAPKKDAPAAAADSFELTLQEFCTRLSAKDRRVEMIGAFHSVETKAGRIKATEDEFRGRYEAFLTQPA